MKLAPDWIERKTAELLARAKRSQFFRDIIQDARYFESHDGYAWDVCLSIACRYWCNALPTFIAKAEGLHHAP